MSKTEKTKSIPASSLKSLGGKAPEFDLPLTVGRVDGSAVLIVLRVKGMRKMEWATLRDEHLQSKAAQAESDEAEDKTLDFSFVTMMGDGAKNAAALVCKAALGWDLDDAFTPENILALDDMVPGALQAAVSAIDSALFQGRLGN